MAGDVTCWTSLTCNTRHKEVLLNLVKYFLASNTVSEKYRDAKVLYAIFLWCKQKQK